MKKLLILAALIAGTASAADDRADFTAELERVCGTYTDAEERRQCEKPLIEDRKRVLKDRIREAELQLSLTEAGQEWMTRFGIDFEKDPEADVKLEVARRRGVLFVAVFERCDADVTSRRLRDTLNLEDGPSLLDAFKRCLEREEKVELALGNVLTKPPQSERGSAHSKAP